MLDSDIILLRIYHLPSGLWEGCLSVGAEEVGRVTGYDNPRSVEQAVRDTGFYPDRIEFEVTPSAPLSGHAYRRGQ